MSDDSSLDRPPSAITLEHETEYVNYSTIEEIPPNLSKIPEAGSPIEQLFVNDYPTSVNVGNDENIDIGLDLNSNRSAHPTSILDQTGFNEPFSNSIGNDNGGNDTMASIEGPSTFNTTDVLNAALSRPKRSDGSPVFQDAPPPDMRHRDYPTYIANHESMDPSFVYHQTFIWSLFRRLHQLQISEPVNLTKSEIERLKTIIQTFQRRLLNQQITSNYSSFEYLPLKPRALNRTNQRLQAHLSELKQLESYLKTAQNKLLEFQSISERQNECPIITLDSQPVVCTPNVRLEMAQLSNEWEAVEKRLLKVIALKRQQIAEVKSQLDLDLLNSVDVNSNGDVDSGGEMDVDIGGDASEPVTKFYEFQSKFR